MTLDGAVMTVCKMTDPLTRELRKLWDHVGGLRQLLSLEKSKRDEILKNDYYDKQIEKAKQIVLKEQCTKYPTARTTKVHNLMVHFSLLYL